MLFKETVARYPEKSAALLPVLWIAQKQFGNLSDDVLEYVAGRLALSPVHVLAVAEFYTMFHREPVGRYHLQLCRNLSCSLLGAEDIIMHVQSGLGIDEDGRSADGLFSLELVECLGSCGTAPVMRINDTYYENLNIARVDELIEACRKGELDESG